MIGFLGGILVGFGFFGLLFWLSGRSEYDVKSDVVMLIVGVVLISYSFIGGN